MGSFRQRLTQQTCIVPLAVAAAGQASGPTPAAAALTSHVCRRVQRSYDLVLEGVGGGPHGIVAQLRKAPAICVGWSQGRGQAGGQAGQQAGCGCSAAAAVRMGASWGQQQHCRRAVLTFFQEALIVEDGQAVADQQDALQAGGQAGSSEQAAAAGWREAPPPPAVRRRQWRRGGASHPHPAPRLHAPAAASTATCGRSWGRWVVRSDQWSRSVDQEWVERGQRLGGHTGQLANRATAHAPPPAWEQAPPPCSRQRGSQPRPGCSRFMPASSCPVPFAIPQQP